MNETHAEFLPREDGDIKDFPLLRIATPMEQMQDLFQDLVKVQETAMLWAEKTVIDSAATRDEARRLLQVISGTAKKIDEKRLLVQKPVKDYIEELKAVCDDAKAPLEKAADNLKRKIEAYAAEQRRREEEEKARILAAKKAEEDRIAAERKARQAEEDRLQAIEAERIAKLRREAEEKAKKEGMALTARTQADEVAKAELARVEAARAAREKEEAERKAKEESDLAAAQQQMAVKMADASGKGTTKGIRDVWVLEIVDETKIPRQFCSYDAKKAKKFVEAGLSTETDPMKIIPGLRCYKAISASGR